MIDTHLHILPGVDDGPATIQESLALARALVQDGIYAAIATPHYNDVYRQYSAMEIKDRVFNMQQSLNSNDIPLQLFAGHEALIKPGLVEDIQTGRVATLNDSRYLLLELWNNSWLPETERVIFELRAYGIVPIIAHPERNRSIQQNPQRLITLLQQGVLAQLTASSLLGIWGKTICRAAETLVKKRLVHCIASDAHGLHRRPPKVAESLLRAKHLIDHTGVFQMTEKWPLAIVNNEVYSFAQ